MEQPPEKKIDDHQSTFPKNRRTCSSINTQPELGPQKAQQPKVSPFLNSSNQLVSHRFSLIILTKKKPKIQDYNQQTHKKYPHQLAR